MKILIVEDFHSGADSLAALGCAAGYEATVAYSAHDALGLVERGFRPDVAFLDLGLPDMDGFELAKRLHELISRPLLLVAISGHSELLPRASAGGFDMQFLKPADPEELIDVLNAYAKAIQDSDS